MKLALKLMMLCALSACSIDTFFYGEPNRPAPRALQPLPQEMATRLLWRQSLKGDEALYLRPAQADGRLYTLGRNGVLLALDADGQLIYRQDLKHEMRSGVALAPGLLLLGTASGELLALKSEDGSLVWRAPLGSTMLAPAAYDGGLIIARTVDGKVTALEAETGELRWRHHGLLPNMTLHGQGAPLLAGGALLLGGDQGQLSIIQQDSGLVLNSMPLVRPEWLPETGLPLQDLNASLQLREPLLFASLYNMASLAIDLRSGELLWQQESASTAKDFALDATLMVLSDGNDHVVALRPQDGQILWRQDALEGRRLSPPTLTPAGIMVLDGEGYAHLLAAEDGRLLARQRIGKTGSSVPALPFQGRYIWQLWDGNLIALDGWQ